MFSLTLRRPPGLVVEDAVFVNLKVNNSAVRVRSTAQWNEHLAIRNHVNATK